METLLSVSMGLGLAAACGFRIFLPPLLLGLAARAGWIELGGGMEWLTSGPALLVLASATVIEIAAYYVPWLDHLLDLLAAPAAIAAGVTVWFSLYPGNDPAIRWTVAILAGGGVAAAAQLATVALRHLSLWTTGGLANPVVATIEALGAAVLSLIALLVPLLAAAAVLCFLFAALAARPWRYGRQRC